MAQFERLDADEACNCGFLLWVPVAESRTSKVGIYNDARFPGRSIVSLRRHYAELDVAPVKLIDLFMRDVRATVDAIKNSTDAARVNVSILGNRDPHVHAHLIPRYPSREDYPTDAPWRDPREITKLSDSQLEVLRDGLRIELGATKRQRRIETGTLVPLFTDLDLRRPATA